MQFCLWEKTDVTVTRDFMTIMQSSLKILKITDSQQTITELSVLIHTETHIKKISGELNQYGDGYTAFTDYVLNEIFKFSKDMKYIELIENGIKIDEKTYNIVLDAMFFETKNVALWLYDNNKKVYALVKNGYNGELHETSRGETGYADDGYCPDNKILKVFPLMFTPDDNNFPGSSRLPKEQLRYLRNLIYARHGYIFKNNELKTYFKNFSWYKPNPNFSDDDFSNQEKYLLRILQSEEEKK